MAMTLEMRRFETRKWQDLPRVGWFPMSFCVRVSRISQKMGCVDLGAVTLESSVRKLQGHRCTSYRVRAREWFRADGKLGSEEHK